MLVQVEYVEGGILLHLLSFVGNDDSVEWLLKHNAYPHSANPVSVLWLFINWGEPERDSHLSRGQLLLSICTVVIPYISFCN